MLMADLGMSIYDLCIVVISPLVLNGVVGEEEVWREVLGNFCSYRDFPHDRGWKIRSLWMLSLIHI